METKKQCIETEKGEKLGTSPFIPQKIDIDKEMESFINATRVNLPSISNPYVHTIFGYLLYSRVRTGL